MQNVRFSHNLSFFLIFFEGIAGGPMPIEPNFGFDRKNNHSIASKFTLRFLSYASISVQISDLTIKRLKNPIGPNSFLWALDLLSFLFFESLLH